MKIARDLKVGLALGGGAARGLAHLGVLKALEKLGVRLDAIAGVSTGSMIAAAYAAGVPLDQLLPIARRVSWKQLGSFTFNLHGFHSNKRMEQFLSSFMPVRTFEELNIPLRILATDLRSGQTVVLEKGDLFTAIRASCAIPGLYVPVEIGDWLLADGYLTCNLPVEYVRKMGADVVIASSIGLQINRDIKFTNMYQILMRSFSIMSASVQRASFPTADVVIRPPVEEYIWSDLRSADKLVEAGERATLEKSKELEAALNPSFWKRWTAVPRA